MTPFERPATTREQSASHSAASEDRGAQPSAPQAPAHAPASVAMRPDKRSAASEESLMSVFGYMCDGPGPRPVGAHPAQAGDARRHDDL